MRDPWVSSGGDDPPRPGTRLTRGQPPPLPALTGAAVGGFPSPFQKPAFQDIQVSTIDSNGDSVPDEVVVTAKKGRRTVTATFPA